MIRDRTLYNKAFAEYFKAVRDLKNNSMQVPDYTKSQMMFNRIRSWAQERGLYDKGNTSDSIC